MTNKLKYVLAKKVSLTDSLNKDANVAKAIVKVYAPERFFGWIAGLGGTVRIDEPKA